MIRELINEKRASEGKNKLPTGMVGEDTGLRVSSHMNTNGWEVVSRRNGLVDIRRGNRTITMIEKEFDAIR
jgi:hypothetical protein